MEMEEIKKEVTIGKGRWVGWELEQGTSRRERPTARSSPKVWSSSVHFALVFYITSSNKGYLAIDRILMP